MNPLGSLDCPHPSPTCAQLAGFLQSHRFLFPKAPPKPLEKVSTGLRGSPTTPAPQPNLPVPSPAIGTAYAVLSNPEKRKQYDQFGDDKNQAARPGHGHGDFHRGFEADISPEDLFNMFFGGGFPSSKFLPPRTTRSLWE